MLLYANGRPTPCCSALCCCCCLPLLCCCVLLLHATCCRWWLTVLFRWACLQWQGLRGRGLPPPLPAEPLTCLLPPAHPPSDF